MGLCRINSQVTACCFNSTLWAFMTEPSEYCNGEEFRARCSPNEVIVINEATFGRASVGRCFQEGEQQFGCIANFTEHLDADCSGRRSCTIRVPSATMNAVNTCRPMKSALYASYRCIKGNHCSILIIYTVGDSLFLWPVHIWILWPYTIVFWLCYLNFLNIWANEDNKMQWKAKWSLLYDSVG